MKTIGTLVVILIILTFFKASSAILRLVSGLIGTILVVLLVLYFLGFAVQIFFKVAVVVGILYVVFWLIGLIKKII